MLRIDRSRSSLVPVRRVLSEPLSSRHDLRRLVMANTDAVFEEIGQRIFLLGKDVRLCSPGNELGVDMLGLDAGGILSLGFLTRRIEASHVEDAIRMAEAARPWLPQDILDRLSPGCRDELARFLTVGAERINCGQRVLLFSEEFDFDALLALKNLRQMEGRDALAIQVELALDHQSGEEYLSFSELSGSTLPAVITAAVPAVSLELPPGRHSSESTHNDDRPVESSKGSALKTEPFQDLFVGGWKVLGAELTDSLPAEAD